MQHPSSHYIMVGMSGGVDSSVAALLLKEAGHKVTGVFMKNWEGDDTDTYCPASIEMAQAQAVCDKLGIELQRVNFAQEYWQAVFTHFLAEYRAGRTPNPDILCNKEIKFSAFLHYAKQHGADFIATGHYAQISHQSSNSPNSGPCLLKGADPQKDQSYFLHALSSEQLTPSLFPIGHLAKPVVRELAKKAGFINHAKKDSTGICFIGERKFKTFLSEYLPAQPGSIESIEGTPLGTHDGLMFYTIGQRQGLKIGGQKGGQEAPWFVVAKDLTNNKLIVAQGDHPALYSTQVLLHEVHWINGTPPLFPYRATAKTRYRQSDQACLIEQIENDYYLVHFEEAQRAITPGQSIVFYNGDACLGGGVMVRGS